MFRRLTAFLYRNIQKGKINPGDKFFSSQLLPYKSTLKTPPLAS